MSDGWRSLLSKEWVDCKLHNLPICISTSPNLILEKQFSFSVDKPVLKIKKTICSIYELSKSAADWDYFDFMA